MTTAPTATHPLLPQHHAQLEASGIHPDVIAQRGYRSTLDQAELLGLGFAPPQCRVPALLLPSQNAAGENGRYQLKPDHPRRDEKGDAIKYETPAGASMWLDVPAAVLPALSDPRIPLWITEGLKKADSAVSAGLHCIALLGVWNWRRCLADFAHIEIKDRRVVICFDSDAATNPNVRLALGTLAAFLLTQGARVHIVTLPSGPNGEKVGLDDYLVAGHTAENLEKLEGPELSMRDATEIIEAAHAAIVAATRAKQGGHNLATLTDKDRAELRRAFLEQKERRRQARYLATFRQNRVMLGIIRDHGLTDGEKVLAIQLMEITDRWARHPAPTDERRLYLRKESERLGIARSTLSKRLDSLAVKTGAYAVQAKDKKGPIVDPDTGRAILDRAGKPIIKFDTAVTITPRAAGAAFGEAVARRTYGPGGPREHKKGKPRGISCPRGCNAGLVAKTTTTKECAGCGTLVSTHRSERFIPVTASLWGGQILATLLGPPDAASAGERSDFVQQRIQRYADHNRATPPADVLSGAWAAIYAAPGVPGGQIMATPVEQPPGGPGVMTFQVAARPNPALQPRLLPPQELVAAIAAVDLSEPETPAGIPAGVDAAPPAGPLCIDCAKRSVVPFHHRCQSCILNRLPSTRLNAETPLAAEPPEEQSGLWDAPTDVDDDRGEEAPDG